MKLATIAKYVDQPMILNKLDNKMPKLLILAGGTLGVADSIKTAKKDKKKCQEETCTKCYYYFKYNWSIFTRY